ncbi:MAG: hypothetical protein AAFY41_15430 [Bacteroidota bacterium]
MRKFFCALVLGLLAIVVFPSCSTADSLDDVIQESDLDITASTDDEEDKVAKPTVN